MTSGDREGAGAGAFFWIAAAGIFCAALGLRIFDLGGLPPGLWSDEALNGIDAWKVWHGTGFLMIYPDVFPREPMFETLLALAVGAFGPSIVAMRAVSVGVGMTTIAGLFCMLRREAGGRTALLAAGVLATMRWHVLFSRLIFRTLILPLWIVLIVWAGFGLKRNPTVARAALLGALIGGGFYTYLAWYFMLPLVAGVAVRAIWKAPRAARLFATIMISAAIVFSPLALHYLQHPDHLLARPGAVSVFKDGFGAGMKEIAQNAGEAVLMFHWFGDHVAQQNVPRKPALDIVQGGFFIWGLILAIRCARRGEMLHIVLISWIACGLATTIFTFTDSPNFLRSLAMAPAAAAVVAFGIGDVMGRIGRHVECGGLPALSTDLDRATPQQSGVMPPHSKWVSTWKGAAVGGIVISLSGALTARDLLKWREIPVVRARYQTELLEMAAQVAPLASPDRPVFVPGFFAESLPFQFATLGVDNIIAFTDDRVLRAGPWGSRIVVCPAGAGLAELLLARFPNARIVWRPARVGVIEGVVEAPAE